MNVLIFTGGEYPEPKATKFFFNSFHPDYIIAADSGLDAYVDYYENKIIERNPDYLVGDFDSICNENLLDKFKSSEIKRYSHDKDWTDSELALIKAREMAGKDGTVVLCGGNGGRPDHFLALYDSFSRNYRADIWLCGEQAVYFIAQSRSIEIRGVDFEDRISVSRISSEYENTEMECKGLEWPSLFSKGMASLSNRISKEYFDLKKPIDLHAQRGNFLVFVPFTASVSLKS